MNETGQSKLPSVNERKPGLWKETWSTCIFIKIIVMNSIYHLQVWPGVILRARMPIAIWVRCNNHQCLSITYFYSTDNNILVAPCTSHRQYFCHHTANGCTWMMAGLQNATHINEQPGYFWSHYLDYGTCGILTHCVSKNIQILYHLLWQILLKLYRVLWSTHSIFRGSFFFFKYQLLLHEK